MLQDAYELHADELVNYAVKWTRNRHAAEDLVQDVFLRLATYEHPIEGGAEGVRRFLYTILTNLIRNWGRSQKRRAAETLTDTAAPLSDEQAEQSDQLHAAIAALNPDDQLALQAYLDGDYRAASQKLGLTEAALRKRVSRGLARVKVILKQT